MGKIRFEINKTLFGLIVGLVIGANLALIWANYQLKDLSALIENCITK